ncbi:hypothetical protein CoNPh10_CDS0022 [Staphylococcus phage S-CoN_Ph10]|nr:hypothetical protein CoNPh10_CDS0022 [Staphylococcus phage S-CoN_Ph10]
MTGFVTPTFLCFSFFLFFSQFCYIFSLFLIHTIIFFFFY